MSPSTPLPTLDPAFYYQLAPDDHISPEAAMLFVYGIGIVFFVAVLIFAITSWLHNRTLARGAEATYDPARPRRVGGEIVLRGTVERAANAEHAVRVEVTQAGTESESSGVWSHCWTETDRRVLVHPFYLRMPGERGRVRVEPDDKVLLVDELDGIIRVNKAARVRVAELTDGEEIYACGVLTRGLDPESTEGGYRGDQRALVLRSPRRHPMLLSSESLGARFLKRARFHSGFALATVIVCSLLHVLLIPYHVRRWDGVDAEGTVTKLNHYVTKDSEGDDVHHYEVTVQAERVGTFVDDVDSSDFARLQVGHRVPVRAYAPGAPGKPDARLSYGTTLHAGWAFIILLVIGGLVIAYAAAAHATLPWYQRKVKEGYSGRLPEMPGEAGAGSAK